MDNIHGIHVMHIVQHIIIQHKITQSSTAEAPRCRSTSACPPGAGQ